MGGTLLSIRSMKYGLRSTELYGSSGQGKVVPGSGCISSTYTSLCRCIYLSERSKSTKHKKNKVQRRQNPNHQLFGRTSGANEIPRISDSTGRSLSYIVTQTIETLWVELFWVEHWGFPLVSNILSKGE